MTTKTMIFVVVVAVMTRGAVAKEEWEQEGLGLKKEGLTQCHNLLGAEGRDQGAAAVVFCRFFESPSKSHKPRGAAQIYFLGQTQTMGL